MDGVERRPESPISAAHHMRCAALLRRSAPQQGWSTNELADSIVAHCAHSPLRAHRLARDWTLARLIVEMITATGVGQRLAPSRVSRWERGVEHPSALYRDALCRLYRTGPVELGLDTDYGKQQPSPESPDQVDVQLRTIDGGRRSPRQLVDVGSHGRGSMESVVWQADSVRHKIDETMSTSTVSDATVAYKESVAAQYGRIYKSQPSRVFLRNILADLDDMQVITDRRLPSNQRRELCAVTARLAGLVSMTMVNLGWYRQAREWVHTARLAADEAGEPELRAWVATRGAVASLHLGDPQAAVVNAREAEVLTRHRPGNIAAMAWAIVARATAAMGHAKAARTALHHAEASFAATGPDADTAPICSQPGSCTSTCRTR